MEGLPTGTVTFLFTDLEGSTRLWEEHRDAMKGALARHDEILRDVVRTHSGSVVKTTGDGLHAAFATADHALAAAIAAQQALVDETWDLPAPLRVRMGVHTGAAEERDGDYYGPAVNRAARVAAAAHGGQILVSHAAEELARDTLPPEAMLVDLGEHRLRDLARAERVFQLSAPGLPTEFPPPRSIDAYPGNLPLRLSSFVGREHDLDAVAGALREARLVTLTGVGGVGKTRLAIQVAAELVPYFPDGAWLCELAPASDSESMEQIVVAALGITPRPGVTLQTGVLEYLATKNLVLVLDNCEHLIDAAGLLADAVLHQCPNVHILATSREGLGVEGEHMRVVRSLQLPDAGANVATIATSEATRLFVERARATQGDVAFDDDAMRAIADICRRLDGIPLAIELAAARTAAMAPAEIAQRLDERFRLLTGGRRTAVERHHTLRATVDWSYSLLGERERLTFDRLGAFSGSFDTASAEAVATGDDLEAWDVLDALTDLVAKSMLVREPRSDTTRYTMLETLRQYARERLDEREEADDVRRRHASRYADVAAALEAGLPTSEEHASLLQLADDLDNLRAAVHWALDRDDPADRALALRTIAHLAMLVNWDRTLGIGNWADRGRGFADEAEPWVRCGVLAAAAEEARLQVEFDRALPLARDALRDGVALRGFGPSVALMVICCTLGVHGEQRAAVDEMLAAKEEMEQDGVPAYQRAFVAVVASSIAGFGGMHDTAESLAEESLQIGRALGTPSIQEGALMALGNAIEWKDPERALALYEESIDLVRLGAAGTGFATALSLAALLWHRSGNTRRGIERARETIAHTWRVQDLSNLANGILSLIVILSDQDEPATAATFIGGVAQPAIGLNDIALHDPRWNMSGLQETLRGRLGSAPYDAAWQQGNQMSPAEFIDYVLAETRRVEGSLSPDPAS